MDRSVFGWDLPPGCSMKDIDDAFGERPDPLEDFSWYISEHTDFLTEDEKEAYVHNTSPTLASLLRKAAEWAYQQGLIQGRLDQQEDDAYEPEEELDIEELQELRTAKEEEEDIFRSE